MSSSIALAKLRLTRNSEALAKLRRIGKIVKDQYGERFDAMFDAMPIPFWVGHEKELPVNIAESIVADYVMSIEEGCKHCKAPGTRYDKEVQGTGSTIAGECHSCKGTGWIDVNKVAPIFKLVSLPSEVNPLNPMQQYQQPPPVIASIEVTEALTNAS